MISSGRAGVAHLVERDLAKVEVAGSKPVSRSNFPIRIDKVSTVLTPTLTPTGELDGRVEVKECRT